MCVAGLTAICLGLIPKFGAIIVSIPTGVLGGATTLLYGLIAVLGGRIWVEGKVDFKNPVNLFPAAIGLIAGAANYTWSHGNLSFNGIAIGAFATIIVYQVMNVGARYGLMRGVAAAAAVAGRYSAHRRCHRGRRPPTAAPAAEAPTASQMAARGRNPCSPREPRSAALTWRGWEVMKPGPFAYSAPTTVGETLRVLADLGPDGKVLAGGQSLIPILSMRLATFGHLVDINRVAELDTLEQIAGGPGGPGGPGGGEGGCGRGADGAGGVRVGALARHARVEHSPVTARACPALAQALHFVAHPAVKNRGTVCGALAHADPSSELPAMLALLGRVGRGSAGRTAAPPGRRGRLLPRPAGVRAGPR